VRQLPLPGAEDAPNTKFGEPVLDVGGQIVLGAETTLRFVADAFAGPALQPTEPHERARMNRALELNYREAGVTLGSQIVGPYIAALVSADWIDPTPSAVVLADARKTIAEFERLLKDDPFLAGSAISLADIALASLLDHVMDTPDRDLIVPEDTKLRLWWERVSARNAFKTTKPRGGALSGFLYPVTVTEE
jgi:glutathione S-transferase